MRIDGIFEKEGLEGESLRAYENIIGTRGRIVGPFGALLHSPELVISTKEGKGIFVPLIKFNLFCIDFESVDSSIWVINNNHFR